MSTRFAQCQLEGDESLCSFWLLFSLLEFLENMHSIVMDYPSSDGQKHTTATGDVFRKVCGVDWPAGELTADRNSVVWDLRTVKTFTFDACIDACSTYNADKPRDKWLGVSWGVANGYCRNSWLKANIGLD